MVPIRGECPHILWCGRTLHSSAVLLDEFSMGNADGAVVQLSRQTEDEHSFDSTAKRFSSLCRFARRRGHTFGAAGHDSGAPVSKPFSELNRSR